MKKIPLTQGKFALVDDADYVKLSKFKWSARKAPDTFYATRAARVGPGRQKIVRMHQVILRLRDGDLPDHKDGNGLNNQRHNLRRSDKHTNTFNRRKRTRASSKYKGVGWHTRLGRWRARIMYSGKSYFLGHFGSAVSAARAYDKAAKRYFGRFAYLNFPV